jgi:hypothetical protein
VSYITIAGAGGGGPTTLVVGSTPVTGGTDNQALTVGGGTLGETPIRTILTTTTTYFVRTTGNNSNDGLTSGTAWATLFHAYNFLATKVDSGGFNIIINVGTGTFEGPSGPTTGGLSVAGMTGGGVCQLLGNGSANTIITGDNGVSINDPFDFNFPSGMAFGFDKAKFTATTFALFGFFSAGLTFYFYDYTSSIAADIIFVPSGGAGIIIDGQINVYIGNNGGTYVVDGTGYTNSGPMIECSQGGSLQDFSHWTFTNNPAFGTLETNGIGFVTVDYNSVSIAFFPTFAGAATGTLYICFQGGVITFGNPNNAPTPPAGMTLLEVDSMGFGDSGRGVFLNTVAPAASNLHPLTEFVYKDSSSGARSVVINDGGTIYTRQIGNNINFQTGTAYTLALADQEGVVEMNNAAANTLTVPANATIAFPIGTKISVLQEGAGLTTIAAAGGVTVRNVGALAGQYKTSLLLKRATDEWIQTNGAF